MMQTISATYRVTTPMFLGGAEQQAELRLPSFKGALRFWWRALAWDAFQGDLSAIREVEAELFGSADVGQSRLLMRWSVHETPGFWQGQLSPGLTYLAGMGLSAPNGRLKREAINAGVRFTVQIALRSSLEPTQNELLRKALIAVGLIGGLGARNRRGYGSLTLESLCGLDEAWSCPNELDEVKQQLQSLLHAPGDSGSSEPLYTAISAATRILVIRGESKKTGMNLLEQLGNELLRHRSYGRMGNNGTRENSLREPAEPWSTNDHDVIRDYLSAGQAPTHAPQRAVFGLPHNYFFGSLSQGRDLQVKADITSSSHDRRGSPLFFHIHDCGMGSPLAVITFLPASFLPDGEQVRIADTSKDRSRRRRRQTPVDVPMARDLWEPIESFLNRLLDQNQRKEAFREALEVTHG